MNEGIGRAEGGGVHEERKEARKGTTVDEATDPREQKRNGVQEGNGTQHQQQQQQQQRNILLGRVGS